jgi:hypothetical protein
MAMANLCGMVAVVAAGIAVPASVPARAVMVGGEPDLDACASQGQPTGLKPGGDNFLSVRVAPSTGAAAVFRLKPGHIFNLCDAADGWTGIVFDPKAPGADGIDCGVGTPIAKRQAYAGPCRSGWVSSRYVVVVAG